MQNPKLIPVPFANSGIKDEIPKVKSTSMSNEKASWEDGFPEATMLPVYAGGLPPDGKDFNGVLNQISENLVFQSKGGRYKFDPDFALSIGGYPKGATLQTNDESAEYQSLIDNNLVNFNTATSEEIAQSWRITGLGDATEVLNGKFDKASVKNDLGLSQTEVVSQNVVTELGSGIVGSFEDGLNFITELTNSDQLVTLENEFGKQTYCWTGGFPKQVPTGSTPQSTGGIGKGAWDSVGDASLRGDIENGDGSLISIEYGTLKNAITYVTPEMFGAVGDGVANDYLAFKSAIATGLRVVCDARKTYLLTASEQNESIDIPANTIIQFNGCGIKVGSYVKSVFKINCRASSGFISGIRVIKPRLVSRYSGMENNAWEYEHFIYVDGGWLNNFSFTDFVGDRFLAIKSAVHFDLTGDGEVGVPDSTGDGVRRMDFLKAYNTTSIVSMSGNEGGGSRMGQVDFCDMLLGCVSAIGFDSTTFGVRSAIIIDNVRLNGGAKIDNVYGNPRAISMIGSASINNSEISRLYNETDNYLSSSVISIGTALINGGTISNCNISNLKVNVDTLIYSSKPGKRRIINSVVQHSHIRNLSLTDQRGDFAKLDSDMINLQNGSMNTEIDPIITNMAGVNLTDGMQEKVTSTRSNTMRSVSFNRNLTISPVTVTGDTTVTLLTIPKSLIELKDEIDLSLYVAPTNAGGRFVVSVNSPTSILASPELSLSEGRATIKMNIKMLGNNGSKVRATATAFNATSFITQQSAIKQDTFSSGVYSTANDILISIRTTGGVSSINVQGGEVRIKRGSFINYID